MNPLILDDPMARVKKADSTMPLDSYWVKIKKVGARKSSWFIVPRRKALRYILGIPKGFNMVSNLNSPHQKLKYEYEIV